jgi:hypothetical protein
MGRPRGVPTSRKEFRLESRQVECLEALIATAPLGRPPMVSLVRQAVDNLIAQEFAKPGVKAQVEKYLNARKVVNLREVRRDR